MLQPTYPLKKICGIAHVQRPCVVCNELIWFQAGSARNVCAGCAGAAPPRTVGNDSTLSVRSDRQYQGEHYADQF